MFSFNLSSELPIQDVLPNPIYDSVEPAAKVTVLSPLPTPWFPITITLTAPAAPESAKFPIIVLPVPVVIASPAA